MSEKTIDARLVNKHDLEANWLNQTELIPLKGELIIYDAEISANGSILKLPNNRTTPYAYERMKIGDGIHNHNELPFVYVLSNWNQDDSSQQDYIPNRPNIRAGSGANSIILGDLVNNNATGNNALAEGQGTIASSLAQHVQGKYNINDTANKYAHILGNGTNASARSNAHTIDWQGNVWFRGGIRISGEGYDTGLELATKSYVDNHMGGTKSYHIEALDSLQTFKANAIYTNVASAQYAVAMGTGTTASGMASTALGAFTTANNNNATAIGHTTRATGNSALAAGKMTTAAGYGAFSCGYALQEDSLRIEARGTGSVAIGDGRYGYIQAFGYGSVAIGAAEEDHPLIAEANGSNAFGIGNEVYGLCATAFGRYNYVVGNYSHANGYNSIIYSAYSNVEGDSNIVGCKGFFLKSVSLTSTGYGLNLHLGQTRSTTIVNGALSEDINISEYWLSSPSGTIIIYFSDSYNNIVFEGQIDNSNSNVLTLICKSEEERQALLAEFPFDTEFTTLNNITFSVIYLDYVTAGLITFGDRLHVEGSLNKCFSYLGHVEGTRNISAGSASHCEGADNIAFGNNAHIEGQSNIVYGNDAHVEGRYNITKGNASHTEGGYCSAMGDYTHAEGYRTRANGYCSHAAGIGTIATSDGQTVVGMYNIEDPVAKFVVGVGVSRAEPKNGFTAGMDEDGNCYITIGSIKLTESQLESLIGQLQ